MYVVKITTRNYERIMSLHNDKVDADKEANRLNEKWNNEDYYVEEWPVGKAQAWLDRMA